MSATGKNAPLQRNHRAGRRNRKPANDAPRRASSVLEILRGGDLRSKGHSDQVASKVIRNPRLFGELFAGMVDESAVVRLRAADAIEKITRRRPDHLKPYKRALIARISQTDEPGVRWHVAQMLPRLELSRKDLPRVLDILYAYINDPSRIVATSAMQALADLAKQFPHLLPEVLPEIEERTKFGSPAMKARGRKLLAQLAEISGLAT